jgi:hypothetical protein
VAFLVASILVCVGGKSVAAAGAVPRCHTGELGASLGRFGVGLGNAATEVALQNRSGHECFVYGYPGFGLQDRHHRVQPSRVTWGGTYFQSDPGPHRNVLRPGRRAYSDLAWDDKPGPGENVRSPCEPVSTWLEVTPPDERDYLLVRFGKFGQRICAHGHLVATALSRKARP